MGMTFEPTPLAGLFVLRSTPYTDARGRFVRIFCEDEFRAIRPSMHWRQANMSRTVGQGTVRGMHYQHPPMAEAKLVRCIAGRVFDVAVDIRRDSPTFLRWFGIELAATEDVALFIPEGFAHGFQVLGGEAELLYMHSADFSPAHDGRLRYDDTRIGIRWPLAVTSLSDKDAATPPLDGCFTGVGS